MMTLTQSKELISIKLYFAILLFFISSCSNDILEEKPNFISSSNFYETTEELEAGLNAIYSPLKAPGGNTMNVWYIVIQDVLSDFFIPNGSWVPLGNYDGLDATNRTRTGQFWKTFYTSIRNANIVIEKAEENEKIGEIEKNRIIAEAKFMRALIYFQLIKNYGEVPLRTEKNMIEIDLPRANMADIHELMINDLSFAKENLPDQNSDLQHPSKWAAQTVLADVHLYFKNYEESMIESYNVISSNKFNLVQISEPNDFLNLYGPDIATSAEEIFYLKYTRQTGLGSELPLYEGHPSTPYANGVGFFSLYTDPTRIEILKEWDHNELRRQYNIYKFDIGFGDSTYLVKKFQDKNAIGNGNGGNDYPWYKYSDLLFIYAEASNEINNGPTDESIEVINKIHRRAYGLPSEDVSEIDYLLDDYDKSSFLKLIVKERGFETLYEGKRWMELRRLGLAEEYIESSKSKMVGEINLLWPIPSVELNYNNAIDPVLDQNPGY